MTAENAALQTLGVVGQWIWGDDEEDVVFAQAYGHERTLTFRLTRDTSNPAKSSLATRIVNGFHDVEVDDPQATFVERADMRRAIWNAVAQVWDKCSQQATVTDPDAIIDLLDADLANDSRRVTWRICHEPKFDDFIGLLLPVSKLSVGDAVQLVGFEELVLSQQLGGKGCATLAHTASDPTTLLVFKGVDFRTFLHTYESGHVNEVVRSFYHSIELLNHMPPHPNILPPAQTLVTLANTHTRTPVVCGTLYPYLANGSISDYIERSNQSGEEIPLLLKAQWCHQMSSAVAHVHHEGHTYHMDLKPGNFLLDRDLNAVLIDWEQDDAPISTAAPEIDGTWDVEEVTLDSRPLLRYTKYAGPARRNTAATTPGTNGWNTWNVFPVWTRECPRAAELAEVFSLGRSMWMVLSEPTGATFEDISSSDEVVVDWQHGHGHNLPAAWIAVVNTCVDSDPNKRPSLAYLERFWESQYRQLRTPLA
ncbi:hypothetical protein EJ05DRAFT_41201 [Pseudovirgaria hyperparasitica]|uniref:Protein kinase domain-containing protein n=1 Tax=Pseudovirgaria hyperparasitica TaxID=470096 RepID=A0A6A6WN98_9PEZI|nr:uncharacterized protein EJ05DRAFT_41201 [Pseudovirgaria hyperparasitica]KAF2763492.1 hypothetical protein EJ05DRAFT_41201 [Pseudovirgaria hyperparasitica]